MKCNGSLIFSVNFIYINILEGSYFNVLVIVFNNIFNVIVYFVVSLYNGINGVSINCFLKVELNFIVNVVLKMLFMEILFDGVLRVNLFYGNNDEDE